MGLGSALFLLVGVAFCMSAICLPCYVWMLQSWNEVPATVLATELKTHEDTDGSKSYEATVRYAYSVGPRHFIGTRLGAFEGSDNFGNYQRDWHRRLKRARERGETVVCYVNPADPADALLDRGLRLELLLFMAAMGGGFCFGGTTVLRAALQQARSRTSPASTS